MKMLILLLASGGFLAATDRAAAQPVSMHPSVTFAAQKAYAFDASRKPFFTPPEEIGTIRHGAYHEFVGLFINAGLATWTGFDVDRAEAVKVQRYAPPRTNLVPDVLPAGSTLVRREIPAGESFDLVTRKQLTGAQLDRLIELANRLWVKTPAPILRPATDVHNAIILIDGPTWKDVGGPGLLPAGDAQALGNELTTIFTAAASAEASQAPVETTNSSR